LGHTGCGAIKGACDDVKMGNLTHLIEKIKPAVSEVKSPKNPLQRTSKNLEFVDAVAEKNVYLTIENIREQSEILRDMENNKEIMIIGAMYDISDGSVTFFE
ncbi:MAG: carbonic anhydrase, partial [Flavobacteriaceae bacterium]|nr:carbonic anhydrase [Flavobacteriaceae bacterium]